MMTAETRIKTRRFDHEVTIELFDERVELRYGEHPATTYTFEEVMADPLPLCTDPPTEYAIICLVAERLRGRDDLSTTEAHKAAFYQHYQPERCAPWSFDHPRRPSETLKLGPFGLERWHAGAPFAPGPRLLALQRPERLFFAGPDALALPREVRRRLRRSLHDALVPQDALQERDGFPLLDYPALKQGEHRWERGDMVSGATLEIGDGCGTYCGWTHPKDGGQREFSLEAALHDGPERFGRMTNGDFRGEYESFCLTVLHYPIQ